MPDTFQPITDFSGAAFTWRRVRKPTRRIELRSGPHLVATLVRESLTESRLLGTTAGGSWLLVRTPPRSFVVEDESWTAFDPATIDTESPYCAAWLRGASAELPDGLNLRWAKTSFFSHEWRFTTPDATPVLSLLVRRDFDITVSHDLTITVSRDFELHPSLPVLTLLAWRHIIESEEMRLTAS